LPTAAASEEKEKLGITCTPDRVHQTPAGDFAPLHPRKSTLMGEASVWRQVRRLTHKLINLIYRCKNRILSELYARWSTYFLNWDVESTVSRFLGRDVRNDVEYDQPA